MGKLWYVSAALASTAVARRFMRGFRQLVRHLFLAFGALTTTACAGPSASVPTGGSVTPGAAVVPNEAGSTANLGGSRCHGAVCTCRNRAGDPAENPPPNEAHKRFDQYAGWTEGTVLGVATRRIGGHGTFVRAEAGDLLLVKRDRYRPWIGCTPQDVAYAPRVGWNVSIGMCGVKDVV